MKNSTICFVLLLTVATWCASADAQTALQAPASPAPSGAATTAPVIDPARELKGRKLMEALRAGGYVLYMRHAQQGTYTVECTTSNLSALGEEQARTVGAALRELKIPVGLVRASKFCRASDTARVFDVGPVEITEDLNPGAPEAARLKRIGEMPAKGMNTILVAHGHQTAMIELSETIVYLPDGNGAVEPVARIPLAAWDELKKVAAPAVQ